MQLLGDAEALVRSLAGRWGGSWFDGQGAPPGGFHLSLEPGPDGAFTGSTREKNFGPALVATLDARVEGRVDAAGGVRFEKQYAGPGEIDHLVRYVGRLSPDGRTVLGEWEIPDAEGRIAGGFVIHVGGPPRELPLIPREPRTSLTGVWTGVTTGPGPDDAPAHLTLELQQDQGQLRGDAVEDDGGGFVRFDVEGKVNPEGRVRMAFRPPGVPGPIDCRGWLAPNERGLGGWWQRDGQRGLWMLVRG